MNCPGFVTVDTTVGWQAIACQCLNSVQVARIIDGKIELASGSTIDANDPDICQVLEDVHVAVHTAY